jgi:CheY-like chemotaxis protein
VTKVVMVVDDDESIREALASVFEEEGYTTLLAENGRVALEQLAVAAERPCVIVLDLMMPVMDGWQFRNAQKSSPTHADIPVIVVTAAGNDRSCAIEADATLHKPLNATSIVRAVEQFCGAA